MAELNIIPECYVDTKVAEILGQAKGKYNHQKGCGNVANKMIRLNNSECLGIIDEDLNKGAKAAYFSEFNVVLQTESLILKIHKQRKHYLILIRPEIEKWLMNDANAIGINPSHKDYNLPADLQGFKEVTKIKDIDKNEGFKNFVKKLIREEAPSITTLKHWIGLFKNNELHTVK
ncbi:MAG: hypothetical protein H7221_09000 [Flavobacterium sp.]|nr:hypothetical protein [Flavobacterium sp.]